MNKEQSLKRINNLITEQKIYVKRVELIKEEVEFIMSMMEEE